MTTARALPMVRIYLRTYDTADAPIAIACGSRSLRVKFMAAVGLVDEAMDAVDSEEKQDYYDGLTECVEAVMRTRPPVRASGLACSTPPACRWRR